MKKKKTNILFSLFLPERTQYNSIFRRIPNYSQGRPNFHHFLYSWSYVYVIHLDFIRIRSRSKKFNSLNLSSFHPLKKKIFNVFFERFHWLLQVLLDQCANILMFSSGDLAFLGCTLGIPFSFLPGDGFPKASKIVLLHHHITSPWKNLPLEHGDINLCEVLGTVISWVHQKGTGLETRKRELKLEVSLCRDLGWKLFYCPFAQ